MALFYLLLPQWLLVFCQVKLRYGAAIIWGILIVAGRAGYLNFSNKIFHKVKDSFQKHPPNTLETEKTRMAKVVKDYPLYQFMFAVIIAIALAVIVFLTPFWAGFAYPVVGLFLVILLIEAQSKVSIDNRRLVNWGNEVVKKVACR